MIQSGLRRAVAASSAQAGASPSTDLSTDSLTSAAAATAAWTSALRASGAGRPSVGSGAVIGVVSVIGATVSSLARSSHW